MLLIPVKELQRSQSPQAVHIVAGHIIQGFPVSLSDLLNPAAEQIVHRKQHQRNGQKQQSHRHGNVF